MNKTVLLIGLVPVICGGIGFGAGMVLKPEPAAVAAPAAPGKDAAREVLERLANEAPAPVPEPKVEKAPGEDAKGAPAAAPQVAEAKTAETPAKPAHGAADDGPHDAKVVQVGRISVPVYKPGSITYVVADFGIAVENQDQVALYSIAENATRLRDAILTSMHRVAETPMLKGPAINSDELAEILAADLRPEFAGVTDVLFLSLHKTDVPRG